MADEPHRSPLWLPKGGGHSLPLTREALLALDARIKPDFKRAIACGLIAVVCLSIGARLGGLGQKGSFVRHDNLRFLVIAVSLAFAAFGAVAVRSAGREFSRITRLRAGPAAGSGIGVLVSLLGYSLVLLGVLQLVNVNLGSLLVGGAVTGVVLGIAAQQSLGNFFAGLVLMFSRPYVPGQRVTVHTGALGGPFEGTIVEAGLVYTTLQTETGYLNIPNAGLLAAAIGPPLTETDAPGDA
jgi:small-conductance mechanosensitive channel